VPGDLDQFHRHGKIALCIWGSRPFIRSEPSLAEAAAA